MKKSMLFVGGEDNYIIYDVSKNIIKKLGKLRMLYDWKYLRINRIIQSCLVSSNKIAAIGSIKNTEAFGSPIDSSQCVFIFDPLNCKSRKNCKVVLLGTFSDSRSIKYFKEKNMLIVESRDPYIRFISLSENSEDEETQVVKVRGHTNRQMWWLNDLSIIPRKDWISFGSDRRVRIMDLNRSVICSDLIGHEEQVYSTHYSPETNLLLSSSEDETVRVWDPNQKRSILTLEHDKGHIICVKPISATNKYLFASGSEKGYLTIWDLRSPSQFFSQSRRANDGVHRIERLIDQSGEPFVTCSWDGNIRFFAGKKSLKSLTVSRTVRFGKPVFDLTYFGNWGTDLSSEKYSRQRNMMNRDLKDRTNFVFFSSKTVEDLELELFEIRIGFISSSLFFKRLKVSKFFFS